VISRTGLVDLLATALPTVRASGVVAGREVHRRLVSAVSVALALAPPEGTLVIDLLGATSVDSLCTGRLGWATLEAHARDVRVRFLVRPGPMVDELLSLRKELRN